MAADPAAPVNLRCPRCGYLRRPILFGPLAPPDMIVIACEECMRRHSDELLRRPLRVVADEDKPPSWPARFYPAGGPIRWPMA